MTNLTQKKPIYTACLSTLRAFLAASDDPTGLKLSNLREQARDLKLNVEEVNGLLAQMVEKQEEPS